MGVVSTKVFLEDYEVNINIGIHEFEKTGPQRIVINIELFVTEELSGDSDTIDNAVDYDFLRKEITKLIETRHFNLQETLCRSILDIVKVQPGVQRAIIKTKKPDVYPDCRGVGVEMVYYN
jgi:dihydroneopterin aldolase